MRNLRARNCLDRLNVKEDEDVFEITTRRNLRACAVRVENEDGSEYMYVEMTVVDMIAGTVCLVFHLFQVAGLVAGGGRNAIALVVLEMMMTSGVVRLFLPRLVMTPWDRDVAAKGIPFVFRQVEEEAVVTHRRASL